MAIVAITVIAFWPATANEFVDWDDFQNWTENEHIRSLSARNLYWMATATHLGVWQPLSWLVAALEYQAFNGPSDVSFSRGLHTANIALHTVAALLCFGLIRRLLSWGTGSASTKSATLASAAAASLYAVHPLRVELVAWATGQPYLLATCFCLASVWAYLEAAATDARRWRLLSWACFALSLMCKSIAVPLVAVLILLDGYPLRRLGGDRGWFGPGIRRVWLEKIPYAFMAAAVVVVAILGKGGAQSTFSLASHGLIARGAQACYGLVFYVVKTFAPVDLSPIYELRLPFDYTHWRYPASAVALIVVAGISIALRRRWPTVLAAAGGYALLISPTLGFLQSGNQEVADRYSYLPAVAGSALIAVGLTWLWHPNRRRKAVVVLSGLAVVAAILVLTGLTRRQCRMWHDTGSLWLRAVAVDPNSSLANNGAGYVLLQRGQIDEAIVHLRKAIRLKNTNDKAHYNLWDALRQRGDTEALIAAYREGIPLLPDKAPIHHQLGDTYFALRDFASAIACYSRALDEDPNYAVAHGSLSGALIGTGDRKGAIRHARQAVSLDPSLGPAWRNLARALRDTGRTDEAIVALTDALRHDPTDDKTRRLLEQLTSR
ncbi:MAG: tetratricopeptide repeat protein [Planctomycetes bacterium]|nr:tetratricopeptide repeat protein [Planctomycetota bacterium]